MRKPVCSHVRKIWILGHSDAINRWPSLRVLNHQSSTLVTEEQAPTSAKCFYGVVPRDTNEWSILHREFLSGNHCNQQQKQQFLKKTWGTQGMSLSTRQKTKSDSEENNLFKKSPDCREFSSANNAWNLFFANCTCSELHSLHFLFSWYFKHENANEIYMIAEQVILALLRNPHNRYGFNVLKLQVSTRQRHRLHPVCILVQYSSGPETIGSRYVPPFLYLSAYFKCRLDLVLTVLRL